MQLEDAHGFTLCDLGPDDHAEVVNLWTQAGLSIRLEGRDAAAAFARQCREGRQRIVGFRDRERLVAAAVLTHDGRKGWINRLAVEPGYRHRGLATRLVREAERWFTEELGLEVWAALIERDNTESLALFDTLGFQRHDIVYVTKRTRPDA